MLLETVDNSNVMEFKKMSIDGDLENNEIQSDADDCDEIELKSKFNKSYTLSCETALTLNKNYILHISCTRESNPNICVGLSDNTCEIYNLSNNQLRKTAKLDSHTNSIVNVKFGSDPNLIYTGSVDGSIKLWDLRTPKESILNFIDTTVTDPSQLKPFTSFDVAPNNRLLCAGTELFENESFLLFWDIRSSDLLGGYWESHTDDITAVLFHPEDNNKLATGSTDGLINIFNLKETTEDDALINSINTDSSVEQLVWYKNDDIDAICCITHTADVQLWDTEEIIQLKTFNRTRIAKEIHRQSTAHVYITNAHTSKNDLFFIAGSNWNNGECVRGVKVENSESISPYFRLLENKQRVRTSWYNNEMDLLITGGELSILSVWQGGKSNIEATTVLKSSKDKFVRVQPY